MDDDQLTQLLGNIAGDGFVSSLRRSLNLPSEGGYVMLAVKLSEDDLAFLEQRGLELAEHARLHTTKPLPVLSPEYLVGLLVQQWRKEARW